MKVGILGGTFDPVHKGHIEVGQIVLENFEIEKIVFLPNGNPPHKKNVLSYQHRIQMINIAIKDLEKFELSKLESNCKETHYTVDTIIKYKYFFPKDDIYFIIGGDSFETFHKWKDHHKILKMSNLIVVTRPNYTLENDMIEYRDKIHFLKNLNVDIESRKVRECLKNKLNTDCFLDKNVKKYIFENNLYI